MKRTGWGSPTHFSSLSSSSASGKRSKNEEEMENKEIYLLYSHYGGPIAYELFKFDARAIVHNMSPPIEEIQKLTPVLELPRELYPRAMGAFSVGSKIYLIGGEIENCNRNPHVFDFDEVTIALSNRVSVFDMAGSSTFPLPLEGPQMNGGKTIPHVVSVNGMFYVLSESPTLSTYFNEMSVFFEVFNPDGNEGKGEWSPLPNPPFYPRSHLQPGVDGFGVMILSHAVLDSTIFFSTILTNRMYAFHTVHRTWECFDLGPNFEKTLPFMRGPTLISGNVWAAIGRSFVNSPVATYDLTAEFGLVGRKVEDLDETISSHKPPQACFVYYHLIDLKHGWLCLLKYACPNVEEGQEDYLPGRPYVYAIVFRLVKKYIDNVQYHEMRPWPAHKRVSFQDPNGDVGEIQVFGASELNSSLFDVGVHEFARNSALIGCFPMTR